MSTTVKTQKELDAAVAAGEPWIEIRSKAGVWLEVHTPSSSTVTAYGSSAVRASGSSTVRASGSSTVRAYGSSTVTASGSSAVTAYDSSTVTASGSSTVTASGSSTVTAYDSSTVTASGSSTVRAYDSSTVRAYDSSTVTASKRVAVHLHDASVHVSGGVLINHYDEPLDAAAWCDWHDIEVVDGIATLYKAVTDTWSTPYGFDYSPGATPEAPDWLPTNSCGAGLHFSPLPIHALSYHSAATKFVAVGVAVADLRPILGSTPKAKAPRVVIACREVDIDGQPVTDVAVSA